MHTTTTPPDRVIRLPEVCRTVGLARERIRQLEIAGLFPRRISITGGRAVGWSEREVQAWLRDRIATARAAA